MKILVSGASGFVGSCLVEFLRRDHSVVRCSRGRLESVEGVADFAVGDISADTDWGLALQGVDVVVHLAALAHRSGAATPTLERYREVNTKASVTLARQAVDAGVGRYVFLSSIGVNGRSTTRPFTEESPCRPHSDYAMSKYEAELALAEIAHQSTLDLVVVRAPLVYGSQAPANFRQLVRLVAKLSLLPFGLVANARSLVHVENLAGLIELCCRQPQAAGEIFLASDEPPVSIRELTHLIAQNLDKRIWQLPVPVGLMRLAACLIGRPQLASQLFDDLEVDSAKARTLLQWEPAADVRAGILGCDFAPMFESAD